MANKIIYKTKKPGKRRSLCSGYKVFPDGEKCPGCADCVGKNSVKKHLKLLEKRMFVLSPKTKSKTKKARK